MTALVELLSKADRQRLEARLDELRDLDRLMREPGLLSAPREDREDTTAERNPS